MTNDKTIHETIHEIIYKIRLKTKNETIDKTLDTWNTGDVSFEYAGIIWLYF